MSGARSASFLMLLATACGDDPLDTRPPANDGAAPLAALSVDRSSGLVPLAVAADASASRDNTGSDALQFRWDFDGDGAWDTPYGAGKTTTISYSLPGDFTLTVEVRSPSGRIATAVQFITAIAGSTPIANLDVDTNRDGVVNAGDDAGEEVWSSAKGAVVLANLDDDDGNGARDGNDQAVNGTNDLTDLAPILVHQIDNLASGHTVQLLIGPDAAVSRLRIFRSGTSPLLLTNLGTASLTFANDELSAADVPLALEVVGGRSASWNGEVSLTLQIRDGANLVSEDRVAMHVAPTLFVDDTQPGRILYVMRISNPSDVPNLSFYNRLTGALPGSFSLFTVSEQRYWADRWVQDNMQTGYSEVPGNTGRRVQNTYLQTERDTGSFGLEPLLPSELLAGDFGFAYPAGQATSLNYGGNLEIAPPHAGFPLGRIMVGGGSGGTLSGRAYSDRMTAPQRSWLDAQGVQGPTLELSTEWLAVGHIDEILLFVPDANSTSGRPYKVVIASPDLARRALDDLATNGRANATVFAGRPTQTTVAAILADADLMAYNDAAQARIDSVRLTLAQSVGLDDQDFLEVPVLYEPNWFGSIDLASAYSPGMQNLVALDSLLVIPDPEGPDGPNGDVWQEQALAALAPLGVAVLFVDVFESYHLLMGEAHCGINIERAPYATPFWEVEP